MDKSFTTRGLAGVAREAGEGEEGDEEEEEEGEEEEEEEEEEDTEEEETRLRKRRVKGIMLLLVKDTLRRPVPSTISAARCAVCSDSKEARCVLIWSGVNRRNKD